jgi:hypothetical protein
VITPVPLLGVSINLLGRSRPSEFALKATHCWRRADWTPMRVRTIMRDAATWSFSQYNRIRIALAASALMGRPAYTALRTLSNDELSSRADRPAAQ